MFSCLIWTGIAFKEGCFKRGEKPLSWSLLDFQNNNGHCLIHMKRTNSRLENRERVRKIKLGGLRGVNEKISSKGSYDFQFIIFIYVSRDSANTQLNFIAKMLYSQRHTYYCFFLAAACQHQQKGQSLPSLWWR